MRSNAGLVSCKIMAVTQMIHSFHPIESTDFNHPRLRSMQSIFIDKSQFALEFQQRIVRGIEYESSFDYSFAFGKP